MSVYVFGNCTEDVFLRVDRLPIDGETTLAASRDADLGGKGANQAVAAGRCGVPTYLVASLGDDLTGKSAQARLELEGVDLRFIEIVVGPTDQSMIVVAGDGANFIVSTNQAALALTPERCASALAQVGAGDIVVLQGNLSLATTAACLHAARRRRATTFINPAPIAFSYDDIWQLVDYAVVNEVEAHQLGGSDDPAAAGHNLRAKGVGVAIVTLGGAGALILEEGGDTRIPAPPAQVVDTTGAGDVFCGVIAARLAAGAGLHTAVEAAVRAASLSVERTGTQSSFPTVAEMRKLFSG